MFKYFVLIIALCFSCGKTSEDNNNQNDNYYSKIRFVDVDTRNEVSLDSIFKKDYFLLTFGATDCRDCVRKADDWQKSYDTLQKWSDRLDFAGVYTDEGLHAIHQYIMVHNYNWIKYQDPNAKMMEKYFLPEQANGQGVVPETVLLKKDPPSIVAIWTPTTSTYTVADVMLSISKLIPQN